MLDHYWVNAHGAEQDRLELALAKALSIAIRNGEALFIVVPTLKDARDTVLGDYLGTELVKNLANGEVADYQGTQIRLLSKATFKSNVSGVQLLLWPDPTFLEKVDSALNVSAVIALEWNNYIVDWVDKHQAVQVK